MKFVALFLLVSCADATITPRDMDTSLKSCIKNDGVNNVEVFPRHLKIYCTDGATFVKQREKS